VSSIGIAKGTLVVAGILLFLWGGANDVALLRWIAIALIVAAWSLRFFERGSRSRADSEPEP
jgi:hypothetical protein